jgi:hypothetical protein
MASITARIKRCTGVKPRNFLGLPIAGSEVVPAAGWNLALSSKYGDELASSRRLSSMRYPLVLS